MGACHIQALLFLFLLGAFSLALAQYLSCHIGKTETIEEDPSTTFNWTTDQVDTCDSGALCQETVIMIKAGAKTAIVATKGCVSEGKETMTFIQHTGHPGPLAISYSSYCLDALCNNKNDLSQLWKPQILPASDKPAVLRCPTCVALGSCLRAPALPCPIGTTRCYQGKIELSGGGINSTVEVKGCTAMTGCRLMARVSVVGPILVKEKCPPQSLLQPRKAENGAPWLLISGWRLELLLPLLLQPLVHFS